VRPELVPDDMVEIAAEVLFAQQDAIRPHLDEDECRTVARDALASAFGAPSLSRHFVTFGYRGWRVEHSVECRLSGEMERGCLFEEAVHAMGEPDADQMGRWCITEIDSEGLPSLRREEMS